MRAGASLLAIRDAMREQGFSLCKQSVGEYPLPAGSGSGSGGMNGSCPDRHPADTRRVSNRRTLARSGGSGGPLFVRGGVALSGYIAGGCRVCPPSRRLA